MLCGNYSRETFGRHRTLGVVHQGECHREDYWSVDGPTIPCVSFWKEDREGQIKGESTQMSEPLKPLEVQHGGSHYKSLAIQPIEYCHKNKLGACESYAIKHLTRHYDKGKEEDLKKAIHYVQLLLEFAYGITSHVTYEENGK